MVTIMTIQVYRVSGSSRSTMNWATRNQIHCLCPTPWRRRYHINCEKGRVRAHPLRTWDGRGGGIPNVGGIQTSMPSVLVPVPTATLYFLFLIQQLLKPLRVQVALTHGRMARPSGCEWSGWKRGVISAKGH